MTGGHMEDAGAQLSSSPRWCRNSAPACTGPAVVLTVLADLDSPRPDRANATNRAGPAWEDARVRSVTIMAEMRPAEECYRNVRRYSAGAMPVARRNARVKLDWEENRLPRAISPSDARPVAIIALALSSRRWLT
jgi:hypothetical protein